MIYRIMNIGVTNMPAKKEEVHTDRVSSGIAGLDEHIGGGFVRDDVYLITGATGTGKTIFCLQFLWDGLQKDENGIFFSLEELANDVMSDAKIFGWDFQPFIDQKKFLIQYSNPFEMLDITSGIRGAIKKFNAKRVVIDSTSMFGLEFESAHKLRNKLYSLIKELKGSGCVVLMTAEILEDQKGLSRYGVEEFVADGVIMLNYLGIGSLTSRSMVIRKMRRTNHGTDVYPFSMTSKGIVIEKEKF